MPTLAEVKGKVDFGIITIREDEFEAVLRRLPKIGRVSGRREYNIRKLELQDGQHYLIAVIRCIEQGNGEAQSAAEDLIAEIQPRWLLVVGIGGGAPADDFSLGDVVVSTRIHDFSVEAVLQGQDSEFALTGGPLHRTSAPVAANIPALKDELADWHSPSSISTARPMTNTEASEVYGDDEWRKKILRALGQAEKRTHPVAITGAIGSSDKLIKDADILSLWMKFTRQIRVVEMESAGVYRAAHRHDVPSLSIRGISDIVGLKRDPAWTPYACDSAAAFTCALLRTLPIPLNPDPLPLDSFTKTSTVVTKWEDQIKNP